MGPVKNEKKILYISYDGMTDPLGQSQVINYLIGLTKYGYIFHILSFEKKEKWVLTGKEIQSLLDENATTGTSRVKRGMAEMLKGGVIMDVVTPEQPRSPRMPAPLP